MAFYTCEKFYQRSHLEQHEVHDNAVDSVLEVVFSSAPWDPLQLGVHDCFQFRFHVMLSVTLSHPCLMVFAMLIQDQVPDPEELCWPVRCGG
jgi:hypothetical protein